MSGQGTGQLGEERMSSHPRPSQQERRISGMVTGTPATQSRSMGAVHTTRGGKTGCS